MKKIVAITLAATLGLSACGETATTNSSTVNEAELTEGNFAATDDLTLANEDDLTFTNDADLTPIDNSAANALDTVPANDSALTNAL